MIITGCNSQFMCRATPPSNQSHSLEIGIWSDNDCVKNSKLSNATVTVCECSKNIGTFAAVLSEQVRFTAPLLFVYHHYASQYYSQSWLIDLERMLI